MPERKTDKERLSELDKKINQLKEQKKALALKSSKKERAARTRRLIQNGALAEKYLHCENLDPAIFEKVLKALVELPEVLKALPYQ